MPHLIKRRLSPKAAAELEKRLERFVRTERWNGHVPGDSVRIKGIRGGIWRYQCHVLNTATGKSWIEVAELEPAAGVPVAEARKDASRARTRRTRTFAEDRVIALSKKRPRRQAEHEQLAFPAPDEGQPTSDEELP